MWPLHCLEIIFKKCSFGFFFLLFLKHDSSYITLIYVNQHSFVFSIKDWGFCWIYINDPMTSMLSFVIHLSLALFICCCLPLLTTSMVLSSHPFLLYSFFSPIVPFPIFLVHCSWFSLHIYCFYPIKDIHFICCLLLLILYSPVILISCVICKHYFFSQEKTSVSFN